MEIITQKDIDRFFTKVNKTDTCWNWTAACKHNGYGQFMLHEGINRRAHRISWMIHNGSIKDDLMVLHKCDNRKCVNPEHLFLGTAKDNTTDMMNKNRYWKNPGYKAENNVTSKLTWKNVEYIRSVYVKRKSPTLTELALQFNVKPSTVQRIIVNKNWVIS
jgi:hypothetical protein